MTAMSSKPRNHRQRKCHASSCSPSKNEIFCRMIPKYMYKIWLLDFDIIQVVDDNKICLYCWRWTPVWRVKSLRWSSMSIHARNILRSPPMFCSTSQSPPMCLHHPSFGCSSDSLEAPGAWKQHRIHDQYDIWLEENKWSRLWMKRKIFGSVSVRMAPGNPSKAVTECQSYSNGNNGEIDAWHHVRSPANFLYILLGIQITKLQISPNLSSTAWPTAPFEKTLSRQATFLPQRCVIPPIG